LQSGATLQQYIDAQLVVIRSHMPQMRHTSIGTEKLDADESACLEIEIPASDGGLGVLRQLYLRLGEHVGVATVTTLASERSRLEPILESIRASLRFLPE